MMTTYQAKAESFRQAGPTLSVACGAVLALVLGSAARGDLIMAEADGDFTTTDTVAAGWTATLTGGGWNDSAGSTDGFYGPDNAVDGLAGAPIVLGTRSMSRNNTVTIVVTNNSGASVQLDQFLFDAAIDGNGDNAANFFSASYVGGGGLGATAVALGDTGALPLVSPSGDYIDFGVQLADFVGGGMLDTTTLADAASATFEITSSNGTSNNYRLDNFAITSLVAPAVPEPKGMMLFGCGLVAACWYLVRKQRT